MTESDNRSRRIRIWDSGPFRRLWFVGLAGSLGLWTVQIGLTVAVLAEHSGSTLAWLLLAGTVPGLLAGPVAGAVVDHVEPRLAAGVALAVQAVLIMGMAVSLSQSLIAVAGCNAICSIAAQFPPLALQRLRYALLDERQWPLANAAVSRIMAITTILGAVAGSGVSDLGALPVFGFACGLQVLGAFVVWRMPVIGRMGLDTAAAPRRLQLGGGIAVLRRNRAARAVVALCTSWGLIGGGLTVLLGIFGTDLSGDGRGVALLFTVYGAGLLVGTVLAGQLAATTMRTHHLTAYLVQGVAWTSVAPLATLAVPLAIVLFIMGIAGGVIIGIEVTLLLRDVPRHLHGRVFSIYHLADGMSERTSLALVGAALAVLAPTTVVVIGGLASIAVAMLWSLGSRGGRRSSGLSTPPAGRMATDESG
ncbi:MFS transporter [Actinoalloteichus hymeniacidonis]|uniref:Arabinose efflux permease family protein n=1 Tax=Actinoalloteichus hymeniacidonis TaxID=340345 RepID=A0AAC9MX63_9PSEU|nr:MFS transporter [Actinoalloteichus hymeniacidonis]AOS61562.1 arabinose efflux permease family protein [Actinoalloteichus hymeniacidonis]MBB5910429.1 putative MFS family arabinose efflux permease [Actinoalloteichus hymeniacidonis]